MKPILSFVFVIVAGAAQAQHYWQQQVDMKIDVMLDDKKHFLHGYEEITYTNNSPDTLRYIYMHLWPNAYKHDHTAFAEQQYQQGKTAFYYAKPAQRGYIDSLNFQEDGNDLSYYSAEATPDIARLELSKPLYPGAQIRISTPFRVKIPVVFSRMGHTRQAYFISQWFPKPAVYDNKGWHPIPYLDQGEFYSEFGSYDVSITLPKNYVVMATGNLLDADENAWLDSLSQAAAPPDTIYRHYYPKTSETIKTLHYHEDHIHDFAWFADKRWIVRKDTVAVPGTSETVTAWAAFLPSYKNSWKKGTDALKHTVSYYGKWVGPYPYKTIKAVQGDMKAGGGMEYPTVTVIDRSVGGDEDVIVHEGGHNWFYGMLGSNERDHAWMDEGINTFYELKTMHALQEAKKLSDTTHKKHLQKAGITVDVDLNTTVIGQLQASGKDQAIEQTSAQFREINYGMDVYYKTAASLGWLEAYMGEENFEAGMHQYYNDWRFKHPYPEDFRKAVQQHTDKDLGWFFDNILTTDKRIDFSIKKVAGQDNSLSVRIKNRTGLSLPVIVRSYEGDSMTGQTISAPFTGSTTLSLPGTQNWTSVSISPLVSDTKMQNNVFNRKGLFHGRGWKLSPFVGTNSTYRKKIWVMPAIGYNVYDGFGLGLLFHNITWPENRFRFIISPLYSFGSKQFNGVGSIGYVWHPQGLKEIMAQIDAKTFSYDATSVNIPGTKYARYFKLAPSLSITFKQPSALSTVTRTLMIKGYAISEGYFNYTLDVSDSLYKPSDATQEKYYGLLRYTHHNARTFNPYSYALEGQIGEDFAKISVEGKVRIDYYAKKKSLYIRAYAGKFFTLNDAPFAADRYFLNSTYTGANDYLYDDTYLGRSEREGFAERQVSIREGGLKIPTPLLASPLGRSDNWLASLNLKTDLPLGKLPVRLFFDLATFADAGKLNPSGNKVLFDGGIEVHLYDVINVYVPLIMSKDYQDYMKSIIGKDRFVKSITFSVQLSNIKWLNASSSVFKLFGY